MPTLALAHTRHLAIARHDIVEPEDHTAAKSVGARANVGGCVGVSQASQGERGPVKGVGNLEGYCFKAAEAAMAEAAV